MAKNAEDLTARQKRAKAETKDNRRELRVLLRAMGIRAQAFMPLIQKALREKWDSERFSAEVRVSKAFRRMFPGIPDAWSVAQYRDYEQQVTQTAADFGIKVNRQVLASLASRQVSHDEFYQRALIYDFVNSSAGEQYRQRFNEQLTGTEVGELDRQGLMAFIMKKNRAELFDIHEASVLASSGFDIDAVQARGLARSIGEVGGLTDLGELVSQVRAIRDRAAPELRRAGISDADLIVLEAGSDPRGLRPHLERIVRTRENVRDAGGRRQARATSSGLTLFPAADEGL